MNIGIISLGLIGGSLFKSLIETKHNIFAVTRNSETINFIKATKANISNNLENLSVCDVIFVAAPIGKTEEILDKLEPIAKKECIILDCASVKEFVMKKKRPYKFIGSHPMAGTESNGFNASFKELFIGAKWVLTPSEDITKEDIKTVEEIIKSTGAEIIITNAKEHDKAVALISHMPLILSQALFHSAKDNDLALKLASSGFRDTTRLAMSNLEMAVDMKTFNSENIDFAIEKLLFSIKEIKDTKDISFLTDIKNTRSSMYSKEGKNIL